MIRPLALSLFIAIAMTSLAAPADAATRFALIVGANRGDADERPLLYAERDAQRVAETLTRLGQVPAENAALLLAPDEAALGRALDAMAARIGAARESDGERPIVFFYYSGHADATALHLGGTRFPFGPLKRRVAALGADVAVFIVDACRSGGIIRAKGARPAEPFEIRAEDTLKTKGIAIITSSSESEDAQESERLGGGVFTHHLLVGLAGAADSSGDARVDLSEAYRYAWSQTVTTTSATSVVQHPSFAWDLAGERDIVVTRIDRHHALGRLRLPEAGHYLIFERFGARGLAAELTARSGTELVVAPGRYLLRRREPAAVWEAESVVEAGGVAAPAAAAFARVPYRDAVRKGVAGRDRSTLSLGADLEAMGPVVSGGAWSMLGAVTLQADFKELAVKLRVRYGEGIVEAGALAMQQRTLGADLGLYHLFPIGPHGVGFGLRGGFDWMRQAFTTRGTAPSRDQLLGRIGPALRGEFALGPTVALNVDIGADGWLATLEDADGATRRELRVSPAFTIGFGVLLP